MKVIKVMNNKVVAVSTTSIRPSDPSWVIVDDNAEYYMGQDVSGVSEQRSNADVKSMIKAVAETEELLKSKTEELRILGDQLSKAKAEQSELVEKLAKATDKTNAAYLSFSTLGESVDALRNSLIERKRMAESATEELLKARAEEAANKAYEEAMAKAKAELNADVLKKGSEKNEKVSGSAQKGTGGTESGQKA